MAVHVALLRGINLGGRNKIPMQDLTALFARAGCTDVRTYIQSGNVVYTVADKVAPGVSATVEQALAGRGLRVPVVTRTAAELRQVATRNPFSPEGAEPDALHVAFLTDLPDPARAAALDPNRSPGDRFIVRGREIYLHCPNGLARTRLTNTYFDAALATTSTIRNWRTTLKLLELVERAEQR